MSKSPRPGKGAEHASNVLAALESSRRPMSAYDLLDVLRGKGVAAPLTVYRALDRLMAEGRVHRIASLNAFVSCRHEGDHDHADGHAHERTVGFAICDGCGQVDEFTDPALQDRIHADLAARAFVPHSSAIEVHGLCATCQDGEAKPAGPR